MVRAGCPFPPLILIARFLSSISPFMFLSCLPFLLVSGAFWTGWFCLLVYDLVWRRRPSSSHTHNLNLPRQQLARFPSCFHSCCCSGSPSHAPADGLTGSAHERDPRLSGSMPVCLALGIQFNVLIGTVREFWHLNRALHSPRLASTPPMPICGPYSGGWTRGRQVCDWQDDESAGRPTCILLAQPDACREKEGKKSTHTASQATKPEDRSRALAGISI